MMRKLSIYYQISEFLKLSYKLKNKVHKDFDLQGFEPSGGVGQKLAIARALYKNTPLIILDEPTAALDPRAEYEIYQSFEALTENRMAFIFLIDYHHRDFVIKY